MPMIASDQKKRKRLRDDDNGGEKKQKQSKLGNQKEADNERNHSTNESGENNFGVIFGRVADRRQKEVARLEPALVRSLLMDIRNLTGAELQSLVTANASHSISSTKIDAKEAANEIRNLIACEFKTICDEEMIPIKRRKSWEIVNEVFRLIDTLTGEDYEAETNAQTTTTKAATRTSALAVNGKENAREHTRAIGNKKTNSTGEKQHLGNINTVAARSVASASATATARTTTAAVDPKPTIVPTKSHQSFKKTVASDIDSSTTVTKDNGRQNHPQAPSATTRSNPNQNNKLPRSLASLSSAAALTTTTAAESTSPPKINNSSKNKNPPVHPSMLRPGSKPPPYEKRSLTSQQHRSQKQEKKNQDRVHPAMKTHNSKATSTTQSVTNAVNTSTRTTRKTPTANLAANKMNPRLSAGQAAAASAHPTASRSTKRNDPAASSLSTSISIPPSAGAGAAAALVSAPSSSTSTASSTSSNTNSVVNTNACAKTGPPPTKSLNIQVNEKPIPTNETLTITLPADSKSKYAGYVEDRPHVKLEFNPYKATQSMKAEFTKRLEVWDPFWVTAHSFVTGLTAPVTKCKYQASKSYKFSPQTAARFDAFEVMKKAGPRIRQVGNGQAPKDNEFRVLIRMLPLYLSKQTDGGKHRADVHLWPKGTYLQIHLNPDDRPIPCPHVLQQRKQQSHDKLKWLGICDHLDITSLIHKEWSSTATSLKRQSNHSIIELGCYDKELYMFSLALCRYRSPQTLSQQLLQKDSILERVSLDEMHGRAKKLMESNEVILDSDSDDGNENKQSKPEDLRSIRFSIRDPIIMAALQKPVRGKKCLHLSCFDLRNFLDLNKSPSGQRWKCGYCENFLSYTDLEHCSLTEQAAEKFGKQISFLQHMVEVREDRSMHLCKPVRSHQERARAKKLAADTNAVAPTSQSEEGKEVVELLDSDSD